MYTLYLLRSAEEELDSLSALFRERVERVILQLAEDPRPVGVRKLRGGLGWRIRVGDYRVVCEIDDGVREVTVTRVRHRREVYR